MPYRPRLIAAALAASAAALAPAPASAAPTTTVVQDPDRPALAAKLTDCVVGADSAGGSAVFTGSMPTARKAKRLWMRFDLERQATGETTWKRLSAPTFGKWVKSRADVSGLVYAKTVEGLTPGAYRAVVRFRWVDAKGRTVRSSSRTTLSCKQPDPRPDLSIVRFRPALAADGTRVAEVTIRNTGRSDTLAPAVVALRVGGVEQPSQTVPPLGPGVTAVVTFPLPVCDPGATMEAVVDPADGIDEVREDDNSAVRPCS